MRSPLDGQNRKSFQGCLRLARGPVRVAGEEAVDETDVVANKEPETEANYTGAQNEAVVEPGKAMAGKGKRQSQRGGDEHHAGNRPDTRDEQVEQRPFRLANCA